MLKVWIFLELPSLSIQLNESACLISIVNNIQQHKSNTPYYTDFKGCNSPVGVVGFPLNLPHYCPRYSRYSHGARQSVERCHELTADPFG